MKYNFLFLFFVSLFSTLQAQYCTDDTRFSDDVFFNDFQIDTLKDIAFAEVTDWQGNTDSLRYDVFFPSQSIDDLALKPAIIIIHGGGFTNGNKTDWYDECAEFARKGYITFTISYRLGWNSALERVEAVYRASQDTKAALRHIVHHARDYQVDTSWLFLGGGSAGSITALNTVYVDQDEWNDFLPGIESRLGALNTSGNMLTDSFTIKGVFNNWGATIAQYIQPSEMRPTISFHGEMDRVVAIEVGDEGLSGSRIIHNLLTDNSICSALFIDPDAGHTIYRDVGGTKFRVERASCFFKSIFCEECTELSTTKMEGASCAVRTSLEEFYEKNKFKVYPNPFDQYLQIENIDNRAIMTLMNTRSTIIYQGTAIEQQDFSALPTGVYILTIHGSKYTSSIKLIKTIFD